MKLSVIICTRNRTTAIAACLQSVISSLELATSNAEVLVVDNGSTDDTAKVAADIATRHPVVKLLSEPQKGLSRARNAGIKAAQGELIIFTDDDCHPAADYFAKALDLDARDKEPVLRGGRVELGDVQDQPYCILTRSIPLRWKRAEPPPAEQLATAFIGANMMMRRELALKLGDFDVRFGAGGLFPGGEEIDYIYRAWLAGYAVEYTPDLVIYHHHGRRALDEIIRLAHNYDYADGALCAKMLTRHPGFLRPLWWDFKKALKEPFGGPLCRPELGISHWSRLKDVARGMLAYFSKLP